MSTWNILIFYCLYDCQCRRGHGRLPFRGLSLLLNGSVFQHDPHHPYQVLGCVHDRGLLTLWIASMDPLNESADSHRAAQFDCLRSSHLRASVLHTEWRKAPASAMHAAASSLAISPSKQVDARHGSSSTGADNRSAHPLKEVLSLPHAQIPSDTPALQSATIGMVVAVKKASRYSRLQGRRAATQADTPKRATITGQSYIMASALALKTSTYANQVW
jgi:hypothetical protein